MSKVLTGARAIFKIQGNKIAYASDCSYNINHDHQPIECLDRIDVIEHAEIGYNVGFTCSVFRVADKSATNLGIQPLLEAILTQQELTAEIIDKITNKTILRITGVKFTGRSGSVGARSPGNETWTFVGLRASDEGGE